MYHSTKYPLNAIGPAKLLLTNKVDKFQQLIFIVHPAICEELINELCQVFDTQPIDTTSCGVDKIGSMKSIEKHCLDFTIFSLTGPASTSLLNKVLGCAEDTKQEKVVLSDKKQVFNLAVHDPRFHIPRSKNNPLTSNNNGNCF